MSETFTPTPLELLSESVEKDIKPEFTLKVNPDNFSIDKQSQEYEDWYLDKLERIKKEYLVLVKDGIVPITIELLKPNERAVFPDSMQIELAASRLAQEEMNIICELTGLANLNPNAGAAINFVTDPAVPFGEPEIVGDLSLFQIIEVYTKATK